MIHHSGETEVVNTSKDDKQTLIVGYFENDSLVVEAA